MLAAREEVERLTISKLNALPLLLFHLQFLCINKNERVGATDPSRLRRIENEKPLSLCLPKIRKEAFIRHSPALHYN